MEEIYTVKLTRKELVQAAMKGWEALSPLSAEEITAFSTKINNAEPDDA